MPKDFEGLVSLKTLKLSNNEIVNIDGEWCSKFIHMEEMSLRGNQIFELPKEIGKMVNLRKLYLNNNKLEGI